jgi:SAM-dependent methyltransferase
VGRDHVLSCLRAAGQHSAARIVEGLPAVDGVLVRDACDAALLRAHTELQRLSEEFLQGDRVRLLLEPMIAALRASGVPGPYRVVDVGCGLGFVVRVLAASGGLGKDVELCGCDQNRALVERAALLADEERLNCTFLCANAFRLDAPAHIYLSTGVLHHCRDEALARFFEHQQSAQAFLHYDIQPSPLAPLGAWLFHRSRMREPLSRHDGIASAVRAHTSATLLNAARQFPHLRAATWDDACSFASVILRPMHAVVGMRTGLIAPFQKQLGSLSRRLGPFL